MLKNSYLKIGIQVFQVFIFKSISFKTTPKTSRKNWYSGHMFIFKSKSFKTTPKTSRKNWYSGHMFIFKSKSFKTTPNTSRKNWVFRSYVYI